MREGKNADLNNSLSRLPGFQIVGEKTHLVMGNSSRTCESCLSQDSLAHFFHQHGAHGQTLVVQAGVCVVTCRRQPISDHCGATHRRWNMTRLWKINKSTFDYLPLNDFSSGLFKGLVFFLSGLFSWNMTRWCSINYGQRSIIFKSEYIHRFDYPQIWLSAIHAIRRQHRRKGFPWFNNSRFIASFDYPPTFVWSRWWRIIEN